jgi:hypothetical protein
MNTLKLEHLAPYLPYNINLKINTPIGYFDRKFEIDCGHDFNLHLSQGNIKPILRPLSDITKEIEVNGEKFVPILELGKLYFPTSELENGGVLIEELVYKNNEFKNYFQDYNYTGDNVNRYYKNIGYSESVKIQRQLLKWHFDIHGLIEKGLAIDFNTLKL